MSDDLSSPHYGAMDMSSEHSRQDHIIIRQILRRRGGRGAGTWAKWLISAASVVVCLAILATVMPGLLWVILAASVLLVLGLD